MVQPNNILYERYNLSCGKRYDRSRQQFHRIHRIINLVTFQALRLTLYFEFNSRKSNGRQAQSIRDSLFSFKLVRENRERSRIPKCRVSEVQFAFGGARKKNAKICSYRDSREGSENLARVRVACDGVYVCLCIYVYMCVSCIIAVTSCIIVHRLLIVNLTSNETRL